MWQICRSISLRLSSIVIRCNPGERTCDVEGISRHGLRLCRVSLVSTNPLWLSRYLIHIFLTYEFEPKRAFRIILVCVIALCIKLLNIWNLCEVPDAGNQNTCKYHIFLYKVYSTTRHIHFISRGNLLRIFNNSVQITFSTRKVYCTEGG
jgi:hypothetical protein